MRKSSYYFIINISKTLVKICNSLKNNKNDPKTDLNIQNSGKVFQRQGQFIQVSDS